MLLCDWFIQNKTDRSGAKKSRSAVVICVYVSLSSLCSKVNQSRVSQDNSSRSHSTSCACIFQCFINDLWMGAGLKIPQFFKMKVSLIVYFSQYVVCVGPVSAKQDAGLLLPPLQAQHLLRVVWLCHRNRTGICLSQMLVIIIVNNCQAQTESWHQCETVRVWDILWKSTYWSTY